MRVKVTRRGGLAGVALRGEVETTTLSPKKARAAEAALKTLRARGPASASGLISLRRRLRRRLGDDGRERSNRRLAAAHRGGDGKERAALGGELELGFGAVDLLAHRAQASAAGLGMRDVGAAGVGDERVVGLGGLSQRTRRG